MPIRAQSADGKIHEFPDGTSPSVIDRVMLDYAKSVPAALPPAPVAQPVKDGSKDEGGFFSELGKGLRTGVNQIANVPAAFGLQMSASGAQERNETLGLFDQVDAGKYKAKEFMSPAQAGMLGEGAASDPTVIGTAPERAASAYAKASPEERRAMRERYTGLQKKETEEVKAAVAQQAEEAAKMAPYRARVGRASDVGSLADLRDYAGGTMGTVLPQLAAIMGTAALTKSPLATSAVSGSMTYAAGTEERVRFIQEQVKGLSPEEQATAIGNYLKKTQDTTAIVAIATGALDLAGPVGTILKRSLAKELGTEVVPKTVKEAVKAGLRRAPREIGEEIATGAAQEAVAIAGERNIGEQKGDVLTKENLTRVFDSAIAEGIGGVAGAGINTATGAGATALRNRVQKGAERELARQAKAASIDLDEESIGATYNALVAKFVAEGMSEDQALIRASRDLPNLIGVPASDLGEVPVGGATKPAPTVRVADVTPSPAKVEPTRTPVQEVTPDRLAETLPAIDADFAENAEDLAAEYGVTELTPEIRNAAAELAVSAGIAPIDAINSVLESAQRTAPTATVAPSIDEVVPTPTAIPAPSKATPLKERVTAAKSLIAAELEANPTLAGLDIAAPKLSAAANQLANGRQPDAAAAINAVLNKAQRAKLEASVQQAPEAPAAVVPPTPPAPPSVDETAVAPVADAIKQAAAPTGAPVPSLAETAARDTGIVKAPTGIFDPSYDYINNRPRAAEAAPVAEEVAPEAAPAPVAEEVAPEAAPEAVVEEAAAELEPEVDPYEAVLEDIEAAFKNGEITQPNYNTLKFGAKSRKVPVERVTGDLQKYKDKLEEQRYNEGVERTNPRYRREDVGQGVTKEAVQEYINGLISGWKANIKVNVVDSVDDLPPTLKEAVIRDNAQGAQGFVTAEGDIYILASNLDDVSDAAATLYHEGLGHLGLRALFNKRLDGVLQQIYDGNKKLRDEADTWFEENSGAYPDDSNPKLRALEEVLAIQSEEGRVDASIWAKITAIIKDMGRRLGIKASFSDSEVRAILAMAHDQIINGPRESATIKGLRYMLSAWHGSPHNFDEFSTSAIGTGEGAQVYGWGLYFSSKKEIAEWYRDNLSNKRVEMDVGGRKVSEKIFNAAALVEHLGISNTGNQPPGYPAQWALNQIAQGMSIDEAIADIEYEYSHYPEASLKAAKAAIRAANPRLTGAGKLYDINLNTEEERLLDLNKPFSEQSEFVKERLAGLGLQPPTEEVLEALGRKRDRLNIDYDITMDRRNTELKNLGVADVYTLRKADIQALADNPQNSKLRDIVDAMREIRSALDIIESRLSAAYGYNQSGEGLYNQLEQRLGSPKAASQALLLAGIRGNTYIGDSSGAKNYVIFNASDVEIANKYRRKKKTGPGKELQRAERMLARSRNPGNLNQATSTIMKVKRSARRLQNLMDIIPGIITTKRGRFMLQFLDPDNVRRLAKRQSLALGMRLDKVALAMSEMRKTRTTMQARLQQRTYRWNKFNVRFKEGGRLLSDLINLSTLYNIDPRRAPNAAAFIAQDDKIREIIADPKLGQRAKDNRIKARTELAEAVYKRRDALLRPENGRGEGLKIFDMAAKAYRETFDRQLAGVLARISNSTLSAVRKAAASKQVKAMFAEAEKIGLYFPLGREGDYWMRIGQGKDREYQQFVSQIDRDLALRERYDEMVENGEKRSYDDIIRSGELRFGDDANTLQDDVVENDPTRMLQGMLNELDAGNITDLKAVKEQLTQMYLQTMPKAAQAAAMQRRSGISGFTANTLRTFATTQSAAANRIARLEHGDTIRNNLAAAYALIQNDPEQDQLKPYVDQFAEFAGRQLAPAQGDPWMEAIANTANRATFLYMMTSLKTAIIQPLQLSTTGMMALVREYGASAPALAFRNMTRFYKLLGTSKLDEDGNVITNWGQPSMNDGGYVNDEPDPEMRAFLKFLWNGGNDRGAFSTNFTGDITGDRQGDFGVYDNVVLETTRKTLSFVHNFMTGAGFHTERISREVMFMSAGVLEYKKLRKAGVSEAEAAKRAEQKAADLTLEALFDYNVDAKPMVARGPIGRIIFQFATFTMNMSSLLIRNFYNAVSLRSSLQERRDASIMFFGTMATTYMWAGATGMPLYTMFMGLADVAREMFRSLLEDEDEDPRMYNAESGNPLAYASMDLWFRQWFLPNMLGGGEAQRAAEMGPISAATDINFNASLSLNDMFFRDEQPADNVADAIQNLLMRTGMGASGNTVKQITQGIDFMLAGDGQRAAEKLMPYNFLRQPLIARRLQEEGYITPKGVELKPAEFYTMGKLIAQAFGFGSTEVAEAQKRNILFSRVTDKIDATRNKVMRTYGDAYLKYLEKPTAENLAAREKADAQYNEYNMEYGLISPITEDEMSESIQTRAEEREAARQLGGIQTNKKNRVLVQDMLKQGQ